MSHINSYPKVYAIGHAAISDLFAGPVVAQEKIDGSQFSFGVLDDGLVCRSKSAQIVLDAPEQMFARAVETARRLADELHPGWVYRAEYLQKPKHNTLAYSRTPAQYLILFDIQIGEEVYLDHAALIREASRLGLEVVPELHAGTISGMDALTALLDRESCLGGTKVEGVVVKNYALFTRDKKAAMGKFVSERFKEKHATDWKRRNPKSGDVIQLLIEEYRTEPRWHKAIQHLREAGTLEGSPRDIGALIREVPADVLKECEDDIKAALFKWAWPHLRRGIIAGLPEWYKEQLAARAFAEIT